MSLFNILRWSEKNRKSLRVLDYVLGVITILIGIWQDSTLGIAIGVIFILAAAINLSEKVNLFLPRIVGKNKDPHV